MADTPLRGYNGRHEWFWEPGDDDKAVYPLSNLMDMYEKSVGRNATLIVGLTPNPEGLIPQQDVKRLQEWGQEINRRFKKPLAQTSGSKKALTENRERYTSQLLHHSGRHYSGRTNPRLPGRSTPERKMVCYCPGNLCRP